MKVVVIGASAAGLKAACRVRRLLPQANVIVLEQGDFVAWSGCGLPYYLSGDIEDFRSLQTTAYDVVKDPDYFAAVKDVQVLTGRRAEKIDLHSKAVIARNLKTNQEERFAFDDLVMATGAAPIIPDIPGVELEGVVPFHRPEQAIALRRALNGSEISRIAILGAGFVGCELCEAFQALWGIETHLFDIEPQVLPNLLDPEMARIVERELERQGIRLHLGCRVGEIRRQGGKLSLSGTGRQDLSDLDRVIIAAGVKPQSDLAVWAGIRTLNEGIRVDLDMLTEAPHVYAVGDCVTLPQGITGDSCYLPFGSLANHTGRIAANHIAGRNTIAGRMDLLESVVGSACLKVFDLNIAATGLTARAARKTKNKTAQTWGIFPDRAHYYPGMELIYSTLVFDKETQTVLGYQAVGKGEVLRQANVAAVLLQHHQTLREFQHFEPAYAPPFANPIDPLHYLAYAAMASLDDQILPISPGDLEEHTAKSFVLDVREEAEVKETPFPYAPKTLRHIPLTQLRRRIPEIAHHEPVLVVCQRGARSAEAVRILQENGFTDVSYLGGGLGFFQA